MSQSQHRSPTPGPQSIPAPEPLQRASTTVVDALARAEDVNPTDLEMTLYDVIDPDALDALFTNQRPEDPDIEVEFVVGDYLVTVRGTDHVLVTPV